MAPAYYLFAPLCVVPSGFLLCAALRVLTHYRDSRHLGRTPYRKFARCKQVFTLSLAALSLLLLFDSEPVEWPLADFVVRCAYFALNAIAWTVSFGLISFDSTRQLEQSFLCQRGFWPASCVSAVLCFVLQLRVTSLLHADSPERERFFLVSRCVVYCCEMALTAVLTYFAAQHPNDFFWTGSAPLLSPRSVRLPRKATVDKRVSACITALKAKQGQVHFKLLVKVGHSEHTVQRQFSEFRALHEAQRSYYSVDNFPNLVFPSLPNVTVLEIEEKIAQLNMYLARLLVPELLTPHFLDFLNIHDKSRAELSALHEDSTKNLGFFEPSPTHYDSARFSQTDTLSTHPHPLYFIVCIDHWEQSKDPDSHVNYQIAWQCVSLATQGSCSRRFSDLYSLHQTLKAELGCGLPSFPKKNYLAGFGKALDAATLSRRKEMLEAYLHAVCNDPAYLADATLQFLRCPIQRTEMWSRSMDAWEYALDSPLGWEGEVDDQQLHYTVYIATLTRKDLDSGTSKLWQVKHRFREFDKLQQRLQNRLKSPAYMQHCSSLGRTPVTTLPSLPRKGLVAVTSHAEIEQRRKGLQTYLQELFRVPFIFEAYALREFVQEPEDSGINSAMLG